MSVATHPELDSFARNNALDGLTEASRIRLFVGLRGDSEDRFRFIGAKSKDSRKIQSDWYLMYESQHRGNESVDAIVFGLKIGFVDGSRQ